MVIQGQEQEKMAMDYKDRIDRELGNTIFMAGPRP
jgi:hypothetical protein